MSQDIYGNYVQQNEVANIYGANVSPFGDLITNQLEPVVQLDFVYGINTQTGVSTTANSATVDTSSSRLRLQSGTNSAGSAIFNSRRIIKYRPGQGIIARFTPIFDTPQASSTQIWGVGNSDDGYFFGYNGTTFGILHRIRTVDTWIPVASWNADKVDGTGSSGFNWNKTFGVPVMIKYPYLGYGDIFFYLQDSDTGKWLLVHTIKYANTVNTTQLGNPGLFFYGQCLNSGNTTNLTMYCGSMGAFSCGERSFVGSPKWAMDNNKSTITTETAILSIRNATTYNGVTNRSLIRLNSLSAGATGNNVSVVRLKIGATLGGTPAFTTINGTTANNGVTITSGNSITSYDIAATTVTGGNYLFNHSLVGNASQSIDLGPYAIFISPGETLTASFFAAASASCSISLNWSEDI